MRPGKVSILLDKDEVMKLCKPGAGADTCIWLVAGAEGFECLYFNRSEGRNLHGETLEERWKAGKTVAKRDGCDFIVKFVEGTKEGLKAIREGKVRPWSEIKQELDIQ